MPNVVVVSQHAEIYRELITAGELPNLRAHYCIDTQQAAAHLDDAEILFGAPDRLTPLLGDCPALRWIQSSWAGVKPLIQHERQDYLLTGVKGIFGAPMSEYVLGWILALERNIPQRAQAQAWNSDTEQGVEGKHAGIMGTGSIGQKVAAALSQFGIRPRGLNTDGRDVAGFEHCYSLEQRIKFASGLDYLIALLPDTANSDALIDGELLSRLKPGAILINGGRANALVQADLTQALNSEQLGHAVLDVFDTEPLPDEHPFWAQDRLYVTSHTAAPTHPQAIVDIFTRNYRHYVNGEPLDYLIDFARGY